MLENIDSISLIYTIYIQTSHDISLVLQVATEANLQLVKEHERGGARKPKKNAYGILVSWEKLS